MPGKQLDPKNGLCEPTLTLPWQNHNALIFYLQGVPKNCEQV